MSEHERRPPPPAGVPGLGAPPPEWPGTMTYGPPPAWPGAAGHGPVIAVPIAPPGGRRPTILIVAIVTVIVLVWTVPAYIFWWQPRHGLGPVYMSQLRTGDCFDLNRPGESAVAPEPSIVMVHRVRCSSRHYFEVTELLDLGIDNTLVPETCEAAFESYVGLASADSRAWASSELTMLGHDGTVSADRSICVVHGLNRMATSSAKGSNR